MNNDKEITCNNIGKVVVTCSECGHLTGIENGEEDFASAIIHCDGCRSSFFPEYQDGVYLTRHQHLQAVTRTIEVRNGMVSVFGSEFRFSQYSFFSANVIVGRIEI
ncbi:hypothetical protein [Aeromonas hydrophila]|uniref:hypothetical protein n=1 Tax=Aeromonas hydrophila TaxID=644 RepID=UPI002B47A909|nr:hypothetical protein [Aeromonas hydrophila]